MIKKNKKTLWLIFIFLLIFLLSYQTSKNAELYKNYLKGFLDPRLFSIIQVLGDADRSSKKINND